MSLVFGWERGRGLGGGEGGERLWVEERKGCFIDLMTVKERGSEGGGKGTAGEVREMVGMVGGGFVVGDA